ncbi:RNA-directed DNA polymerase [Glaciimonas soli]|uniref:Reverse transcriptase n=1 Tax=Glaciimonas soli TaxID=2590999 RepID=A0A843YUY8_9BURK|nr:RNA-directed DNA polymerase [Glaciimonas soli]MQR01121.1 reverse transcriptase [Glaciimonas soli]
MSNVRLEHFERAAADIGAHGDNDTLPFDIDTRFIADNQDSLAKLAFTFSEEMESGNKGFANNAINSLQIFCERLLVPSGISGFRIATKVHPFWNIYFNGLGIAIAELHEPTRSNRAHAYRFKAQGESLFDRDSSWRSFREASIADCEAFGDKAIVVQTDISSFYEHIYHHRLENCIADLFQSGSTIPTQIDRLLNKFSSGRSFGLPIGGQCSRILAELLMASIDRTLTNAKIQWRRYVDDFVLITATHAEAYRALSVLSHALADYGLTLNRTKTTVLTGKHYIDYVRTQLGGSGEEANKLRDIDLHFDPYSDTADSDYQELKETVETLEISAILELELKKGQPDTFVVAQIGRTLKLHEPKTALELCRTLLAPTNLHAFRGSWSKIMKGVAALRTDEIFKDIFDRVDKLLDIIPTHSPHLLLAEANCLHYLRTIRFRQTQSRAEYLLHLYGSAQSETVKRACVDCWRHWRDRDAFIRLRNKWQTLSTEEQRMLWLTAAELGDDGEKFRKQVINSLPQAWALGIERKGKQTFSSIYVKWAENVK